MQYNLHETLEQFSKVLKLQGKQAATIESYSRDAKNFLQFLQQNSCPLGDVSSQTLLDYQKYLRETCHDRDNSIRRAIIGVRQYFRFLEQEKLITSSPLNLSIIPPRIEDLPLGLTDEEFDKLLYIAKGTKPELKAKRDASILCLLGLEGLKAAEIINLKWKDYLSSNTSGSLKIDGDRSRVVQLTPQTTADLNQYEKIYKSIELKSNEDKYMFVAFKGRDASVIASQITRHGIKFMLYELGSKINKPFLNTELLRHHAINYLILNGKSPEEIMQHLGLRRLGNVAKHVAQSNRKKVKNKNEH